MSDLEGCCWDRDMMIQLSLRKVKEYSPFLFVGGTGKFATSFISQNGIFGLLPSREFIRMHK